MSQFNASNGVRIMNTRTESQQLITNEWDALQLIPNNELKNEIARKKLCSQQAKHISKLEVNSAENFADFVQQHESVSSGIKLLISILKVDFDEHVKRGRNDA